MRFLSSLAVALAVLVTGSTAEAEAEAEAVRKRDLATTILLDIESAVDCAGCQV
jgi:hypothetical protein